MIGFWYVIAAYFVFAVALLLGYPKHLQKIILDVPEEERSAFHVLTLLLAIGLIMTGMHILRPLI